MRREKLKLFVFSFIYSPFCFIFFFVKTLNNSFPSHERADQGNTIDYAANQLWNWQRIKYLKEGGGEEEWEWEELFEIQFLPGKEVVGILYQTAGGGRDQVPSLQMGIYRI